MIKPEVVILVEEYDLNGAPLVLSFAHEFQQGGAFSVQVVCSNLAGNLDGVVKLQQSITPNHFVDISGKTLILDNASKVGIISVDPVFTGRWLNVVLTKTGLTGGKVSLYLHKVPPMVW